MMFTDVATHETQTTVAGDKLDAGVANAAAAKEQFLSLLVAQISHQSFIKPMDDKELITQLAQFSSVEQAIETNSRLAALQEGQLAMARMHTAALVGRQAMAQTGLVHVGGTEQPEAVSYTLTQPAHEVTARIVDAQGQLVRTIKAGARPAGRQSLDWEQAQATQPLPPGDYNVQIGATDKFGNIVDVHQHIQGHIDAVEFNGSEPYAIIDGVKARVSTIVQLNG